MIVMAKKFDPIEFNYELENTNDGIAHFKRVLKSEDCAITDLIELTYHQKQKQWVIFIELNNLQLYFPEKSFPIECIKIPLFIGAIKSAFEFELIMKRVSKDPELLILHAC